MHLASSLDQMGNYISCTLITSSVGTNRSSSRSATKVILPTGEIQEFDASLPIKAAEIMLETPNYFLVNSSSLQIGRRFSALNADEDLEMRNVYVMFHMKRLNSLITAADIGAFLLVMTAGGNNNKRLLSGGGGGNAARILPEETRTNTNNADDHNHDQVPSISRLNLDDQDDDDDDDTTRGEVVLMSEFQFRLSMCRRSRKPLLETITEEPVLSR